VSGPDPGTFGGVDHGSIPPVAAFEVADPSFAAGTPFQVSSERWLSFLGLPGFAGSALAGNHDIFDAEVVQGVVDGWFAVAAVGGHRSRCSPGAFLDAFDRWFQPGRIGGCHPRSAREPPVCPSRLELRPETLITGPRLAL
jgi:hypothetical protein